MPPSSGIYRRQTRVYIRASRAPLHALASRDMLMMNDSRQKRPAVLARADQAYRIPTKQVRTHLYEELGAVSMRHSEEALCLVSAFLVIGTP